MYTYEAFTADFEEAAYTAYENFEDVPDGYTAIDSYSGNKDGAQAIYPYEMAVSGVENGSFSLKLNNTNTQATNLLFAFTKGDPNIGELSSGSYAVLAGYNNSDKSAAISVVGGDSGVYNVMKVDGTAQKDYKISAIGFTLKYGSMRKAMDLIVAYTDGTEETITTPSPASATRDKSHFCGVKAPAGKYITGLTIKTTDNKASFIVDDLAIIFDKVLPVPTEIKISGEEKVYTSLYGVSGNSTYTYKAYLADQSGDEMESDVEISLSLSGGSSSVIFNEETGELTVLDAAVPEVTLTAQCVLGGETMTATKTVTVQNASYYNADNISSTKLAVKAGETANEREENDTTGDTLLSREEFVALLDSAAVTDGMDMTVINFMGDALNITGAGVAQMPLHQSGKIFSLATAARRMEIRNIQDDYDAGRTPTVLPTSGTKYYYLQSQEQGGNEFIMNTDSLGDLRVTAMGLVILAHNALSVANGFRVKATYSNGKIGYFSANLSDSPVAENNVFFGIKAPLGHYITNVEIINAGEFKPTLFSKADEFGFVFEVPDIIPLDRDSASLKFSDISDEDMGKITKNLKLGALQSVGASPVTWSTSPAGIIAQDGTLTPPEAPDEKGNTPQVNLIATFRGTHLTKERIFELFVPSKLEMDRDAIVVPTETSGDITLPVSGKLYGSTITWSAGQNSPIDTSAENLGKVTTPQNDKYVLHTATISNPSGSVTKDFGVMVKAPASNGSGGDSGSGGGGGGGGSIAAPTVIPPQKTPVEVKPAENADVRDSVFSDLSTQHWAYASIKELYEKGIVNGTGANTFDPEGKVTREQYLAMLVRAFGFENAETEASFTDVSEDAWYYDIVLTAQSLGITGGYADGSFGIGKNITREEMAVMAYRVAQAAGISFEEEGVDAVWSDSAEISEFAADAVGLLNKNGIIKGMSESEFSPKATSTRAQATVIISRLLEVMTVEE